MSAVRPRVRRRGMVALLASCMAVFAQAAPVAAAVLPPQITKAFGASHVPVNGVTSLSFTIYDPNFVYSLSNVGFVDTFPAGLTLDPGGSPVNGCGGTLMATGTSITLSGVSIGPRTSCTVTGYVVKDSVYGKTDNSVTVTSGAGTGNTSTASLVVAHPPTSNDALFLGTAGTIGWAAPGTSVTLDLGIENPNTFTSLTGVGFNATLPAGLTIASPNGLSVAGGCTAGEVTAVAGSHAITLAGATLAANSGDPQNPDPAQGCGMDVTVVASGNGPQTVSIGPVASVEGGSGTGGTGTLPVVAAGARIYWGVESDPGTGRVEFARLDGSVGAPMKSPLAATCCLQGTAIDTTAGRVYSTDFHNTVLPFTTLDDGVRGSVSMSGSGAIGPEGLAIDPALGRLYFAGWQGETISYAGYKSATAGDLYSSGDGNGATVSNPSGVAVDATAGRIYWTNQSGGQPISYANLDGSGSGHDLVTTGASDSSPQGLVVDHADGLVYWANAGSNKISYAHLNGSGGGDLTTTGATTSSPTGLAFDAVTRRLWWGNISGSVASVQLDATGTVASDGQSLATPGISPLGSTYPAILYPPHLSKAPTLTGSGAAGVKLSCSKGTWSGDLLGDNFFRAPRTFSYRWQNGGVAISGATSSTYTPSVAGQYTCTVIATNAAGKTTSSKSNVADAVAPTVSAPTAAPASGHAITTTIPVKLTWTGTDAGSGVDHYEVWLSTNGAAYVKVASPTSATYTRSMAPSSTTTYRFEVRGIDKAGNVSSFAIGPTFHVQLVDQTSSAVTWSGSWTTVSSTSASGGSYRYASAAGASASFTFTGRAVGFVGLLGTAYGGFEVWLDGADVGPFSENNASAVWKEIVYSKSWSSSASHTIKLVCKATSGHPRLGVDAFVFL